MLYMKNVWFIIGTENCPPCELALDTCLNYKNNSFIYKVKLNREETISIIPILEFLIPKYNKSFPVIICQKLSLSEHVQNIILENLNKMFINYQHNIDNYNKAISMIAYIKTNMLIGCTTEKVTTKNFLELSSQQILEQYL